MQVEIRLATEQQRASQFCISYLVTLDVLRSRRCIYPFFYVFVMFIRTFIKLNRKGRGREKKGEKQEEKYKLSAIPITITITIMLWRWQYEFCVKHMSSEWIMSEKSYNCSIHWTWHSSENLKKPSLCHIGSREGSMSCQENHDTGINNNYFHG